MGQLAHPSQHMPAQQQQFNAARLLPMQRLNSCNSPGVAGYPGSLQLPGNAAAAAAGAAVGLRKGISALDLRLLQQLGPAGSTYNGFAGTPGSGSSSSTPTGVLQQGMMLQRGSAGMLNGGLNGGFSLQRTR
jgi:hypothetical protein